MITYEIRERGETTKGSRMETTRTSYGKEWLFVCRQCFSVVFADPLNMPEKDEAHCPHCKVVVPLIRRWLAVYR